MRRDTRRDSRRDSRRDTRRDTRRDRVRSPGGSRVRGGRVSAYVRKTVNVPINQTLRVDRGELKLTSPLMAPQMPHQPYVVEVPHG